MQERSALPTASTEARTLADVDVRPVSGRRLLRAFIEVPWAVYRDDPAWVPPLKLERRMHLSPKSAYCEHAQWQGWVAYRAGNPVGRISAQIDRLHRERHGPDTGHFGFLDAIDDPEVFAALTATAERWLAERGARHITGPFHFSLNQECGLLVDGFETPPMVMMPHGRPWFGPRLEALGYVPVKDTLAYWIRGDFEHPPVMQALMRRYGERVRVRPMDRRALERDIGILRDVFNDAWANNWGFVPFTEAEFKEVGASLRLLLPDDYVQIAEVDGEHAAFIVLLPNLNEAARDLDGRLLPFGWARLLWRIKRRRIKSARVPLMGVRRRFQNSPLGSALAFMTIATVQTAGLRDGIEGVELSWILEDNKGMRDILESIGSQIYKRYRFYEKHLT